MFLLKIDVTRYHFIRFNILLGDTIDSFIEWNYKKLESTMKNYSSPFSVIEVKENEKKKEKITIKLLYQKEHESREVGEHWNRAERSHVYAVMQNPIESDPVGSLSSLLFFSLHCGQPDRRIKRPWKDDYIFD